MKCLKDLLQEINKKTLYIGAGVALAALVLCISVFVLIITGKIRRTPVQAPPSVTESTTSTVSALVPRHLDGELVAPELASIAPWAVMIDHQVDARPQSGLSAASVVIEAPVEGGITRLMALFAPTSTLGTIGPVRSARPYFVDWAYGWGAMYAHVGGSPEALERIQSLSNRFHDANEMANGWAFWRDANRVAPHSTMTNGERLTALAERKGFASSTSLLAWHFLDATMSTPVGEVSRIAIPYGGSYNVVWRFNKDQNNYMRNVATRPVVDRNDGSTITASNVIVIKTEEEVLDDKGRLRVRTTGSGDAVAYRDGNRFSIRWRRTPGEPMRFESIDGVEFLLRPGKTWIEVTTSDKIFGGVEK